MILLAVQYSVYTLYCIELGHRDLRIHLKIVTFYFYDQSLLSVTLWVLNHIKGLSNTLVKLRHIMLE